MSTRDDDIPMATTNTLDIPRGQLSFNTDPLSAIKLLQLFLTSWSRLESLKRKWGCRKLGVSSLTTTKTYKAFGLVSAASTKFVRYSREYKICTIFPRVQNLYDIPASTKFVRYYREYNICTIFPQIGIIFNNSLQYVMLFCLRVKNRIFKLQ